MKANVVVYLFKDFACCIIFLCPGIVCISSDQIDIDSPLTLTCTVQQVSTQYQCRLKEETVCCVYFDSVFLNLSYKTDCGSKV